ncbi:GNAT family N-acetyltransferase [Rummeliibacillus sp. BSL5]
MKELDTERVRIVPLDAESLRLFIDDISKLQDVFHLDKSELLLDEEIKDAMKYRLSKVLIDSSNYYWHTNWLIISKELNSIIGGIMLKGLPDENGEVIIGYFTFPCYQGKGYMTETIKILASWILDQPLVKRVIADTEKENKASHKVLEKNGARLYKVTEDLYFWELSKKTMNLHIE